jgi:hypothetical protein
MFLISRRLKTQGAVALATTVGALALLGACDDSTARTDLRPEGPPDVLAVLVLNDSVNGLVEAATYCKPNDETRPVLVGLPDFTTTTLCPEDGSQIAMAEDAAPDTFYVRIMFDELLDPSVEDLIPILDENGLETGSFTGSLANTQPVTLKCTGVDGMLHEIAYDGYYSPSGNAVTWPVGPSLVIKQVGDVIVPTNSLCEVTIKDFVKDKQGESVPTDQRGPFKFKVSGIKPLLVDPSDESTVDAFAIYFDNVYAQMNGEVQVPSLCTDDGNGIFFFGLPPTFAAVCRSDKPIAFDLQPLPKGGGLCAVSGAGCLTTAECDTADPDDVCDYFYIYSLFPFGLSRAEFGFGPIFPVESDTEYTVTIKEGSKLKDQCGVETTFGAPSVADQTKVTFKTNPFEIKTPFSINNNDVVPANRKMRLPFTNVVDLTSIDPATEFTMEPATMATATTPRTPAQMVSTSNEGDFMIQGHYQPNTDYTFTLKAGAVIADAYGAEYTNPMDRVIKFKTAPIAITASTPANGSVVTKATPTSITSITFTFNQGMDVTTFTADDIILEGNATTLSFAVGSSTSTACGARSTSCQLRVRGVFTPGDYTLTLKKDAVIKDILGNDYVQPADRIIKFTIQEAPPAPVIPCLGS